MLYHTHTLQSMCRQSSLLSKSSGRKRCMTVHVAQIKSHMHCLSTESMLSCSRVLPAGFAKNLCKIPQGCAEGPEHMCVWWGRFLCMFCQKSVHTSTPPPLLMVLFGEISVVIYCLKVARVVHKFAAWSKLNGQQ